MACSKFIVLGRLWCRNFHTHFSSRPFTQLGLALLSGRVQIQRQHYCLNTTTRPNQPSPALPIQTRLWPGVSLPNQPTSTFSRHFTFSLVFHCKTNTMLWIIQWHTKTIRRERHFYGGSHTQCVCTCFSRQAPSWTPR